MSAGEPHGKMILLPSRMPDVAGRRLVRVPNLEDILEIGCRDTRKKARIGGVRPHVHGPERLEICLMADGIGTEVVAGRSIAARGGEVYIIFPGEKHGGGIESSVQGLSYFLCLRVPKAPKSLLGFRGQLARNLSAALLGLHPRKFNASPGMPEMLDKAISCTETLTTDPLAMVRLQQLVLRFLLEVIACAGKSRASSHPALVQVLQTIESRLDSPPPIQEMARMAGIGVSRFHTLFRRETGCTPMDYVMRRRIDLAKTRLLGNENATVTQIAMDLFFSSSQHFATTFRRYVGMTPREFARTHRHR